MTARPQVLLLRDPEPPDPYHAALAHAGYDAAFAPVLRFTLTQAAPLAARLRQAPRFSGLVLTSPRACAALEAQDAFLGCWRGRTAYTVGPATAAAARALGLAPAGEAAGDAAALAARIIDDEPEAPLLFLSGDRRRDTLPAALERAGVRFEELTVYRTHLVPPLLPAGARPTWVAFFSPSGVEAARLAPDFPWNSVRTAAIGPTTAEALRQRGHAPAAIAEAPTPAALAAAIRAADDHPTPSQ